MASLRPPVERTLLVAKIELSARYLGIETELSANEFAGGASSTCNPLPCETAFRPGAMRSPTR